MEEMDREYRWSLSLPATPRRRLALLAFQSLVGVEDLLDLDAEGPDRRPLRQLPPVLLEVGVGVVPIGEDEGVIGQVGQRADRAGVPHGRVVELEVLIDRRDPPVGGDDGEELEAAVDVPKVRHHRCSRSWFRLDEKGAASLALNQAWSEVKNR